MAKLRKSIVLAAMDDMISKGKCSIDDVAKFEAGIISQSMFDAVKIHIAKTTRKQTRRAMNDADRCRANGWRKGTRLKDQSGREIRITAVGRESILAVDLLSDDIESEWTLSYADWRKA